MFELFPLLWEAEYHIPITYLHVQYSWCTQMNVPCTSVGMGAGGMVHTVFVSMGAVQTEWNGPYNNSECVCRWDGPVGLVY